MCLLNKQYEKVYEFENITFVLRFSVLCLEATEFTLVSHPDFVSIFELGKHSFIIFVSPILHYIYIYVCVGAGSQIKTQDKLKCYF